MILKAEHDGKRFEIVEDLPEVGFYLYVYLKNKCIEDYLQSSIQTCKDFAFEKFGVPQNIWEEGS